MFRNLQEALVVSLPLPLALVPLAPVRQDWLSCCGGVVLCCCAHFNEMTAKLMRNAKNPVSRLQFGLEIHLSLCLLLRAQCVLL